MRPFKNMHRKKVPPKTPRECALYRAKLSCKIGCDVLNWKIETPPNTSAMEYALFNLLKAVEDIAVAMGEKEPVLPETFGRIPGTVHLHPALAEIFSKPPDPHEYLPKLKEMRMKRGEKT